MPVAETEVHRGLDGIYADNTAISMVNPETNSLTYRGYPVQELARACSFEEVCYLLWHGELPTPVQLAAQHRRQPKITLARFEYQFATPHDAARAEGLQHSELPVIELRERDALRIAVELLVFVEIGHKRIR